jgi:hypothetical protein
MNAPKSAQPGGSHPCNAQQEAAASNPALNQTPNQGCPKITCPAAITIACTGGNREA